MRLTLLLSAYLVSLSLAGGTDPYAPLDRHTFTHDGIQREFYVHSPQHADGKLPVVIAIHGYTSTATGFAAFHDLRSHADENGYIIVYPQGSHFVAEQDGRRYRVTSWNMLGDAVADPRAGPQCAVDAENYPCPPECGSCDRCGWASCYDDVGYFEKLLDTVASNYPTDSRRYYVLGMSNGGMMALRLGCSLPERFAAIAPIAAQLPTGFNCAPNVGLPMIHLSGGRDDVVRADGRPGGDGFSYVAATDLSANWARALECKIGPAHWQNQLTRQAGLVCAAWGECSAHDRDIVSCTDPDETHNWPARRPGGAWPTCVTSQQQNSMPEQPLCAQRTDYGPHLGMDLIWQFFQDYARPD